METEPVSDRGEEECANCGIWMGIEEEKEYFVIKERCRRCNGRICENCIPLANRIDGLGEMVEMTCNDCKRYEKERREEEKEEDSGMQGDNEGTFEVIERDRTFEMLLKKVAGERENDRAHQRNMEEHNRLRKLYDSVIELTDALNEDEEDRLSDERMEELKEEIRRLDEGEMVVGDLNSTRDILSTVYRNGVDGMEEEEKATVVKKANGISTKKRQENRRYGGSGKRPTQKMLQVY